MIDAEMKNKLPKLENWEDVLTSNIFGLLDLLDYKYLIEIISKARNYDNKNIEYALKDRQVKQVELWKHFTDIGEPDILVTLDDNSFFIIEVKYFSHEHNRKESAEDEADESKEKEVIGQLFKYLKIEIDKKKSDFIIYLTADYQSLKEIENSDSTSKKILDKIYHIHWIEFNEQLMKLQCDGIEKKIIDKIVNYLDFKGFTHWEGFKYNNEIYDNVETTIGGFYAK